jgi:hypothetical protein
MLEMRVAYLTEAAELVGYLLIVVYRNISVLATFIMFWVTNTS